MYRDVFSLRPMVWAWLSFGDFARLRSVFTNGSVLVTVAIVMHFGYQMTPHLQILPRHVNY